MKTTLFWKGVLIRTAKKTDCTVSNFYSINKSNSPENILTSKLKWNENVSASTTRAVCGGLGQLRGLRKSA